jgi:L-alanine-DL-glutamate epimerase-like enolase superfamily enzyme
MEVAKLNTYVVATPEPHIGGMYWIFLSIETKCGIIGVGEVYSASFHPEVVVKGIKDVFERYLKGHDPHHVERLYRECFSSGFTQRPDLTMMGVLSGLEIACWDIIGKAANKPIYELIGGKVHDKLRSYTYLYPKDKNGVLNYEDPELGAESAVSFMEQGFSAIKFDPAGPYSSYSGHQISLKRLTHCENYTQKIREAVGDNCDILIGTHGQLSPSSAVRLAKRLEKFDPLWFEEPVPPGQSSAMSEVAKKTKIPVATGERLTTKYEFYDVLKNNAASIIQMNLGRVGGILEAKKIASLSEVFYAQIAPHIYNGPVGAAASIQLSAATPNFLIMESVRTWDGFHSEVLKDSIQWSNGNIIPSDKPGLGIELNFDVVSSNSPYKGKKLHLSMNQKPYYVDDD